MLQMTLEVFSKKIVGIFTDFEVGNQRPDLYVGKNFTDKYVGNFCRILCRDFISVNVGIAHLDLPEYTPFLSKFLSSSHFYFYLKKVLCLHQESNSNYLKFLQTRALLPTILLCSTVLGRQT